MPWKSNVPSLLVPPDVLNAVFFRPPGGGLAIPAEYDVVAAFDFGRIASRSFFAALRCMAERTGVPKLLAATIDPDPVEYYLRHFGTIPAFDIECEKNGDEFVRNLNWDPEGGGADSMASHAESLVVLDEDLSWVVLGERRFELARLFVRRDVSHLNLQDCLLVEWRYDQGDLFECLLGFGVPEEMARITASQLPMAVTRSPQ